MSLTQIIIGGIVTALWAAGYLMAFFVDRTLEPLAQSVTPVMLVYVGFVFGRSAIELLRGKSDETNS